MSDTSGDRRTDTARSRGPPARAARTRVLSPAHGPRHGGSADRAGMAGSGLAAGRRCAPDETRRTRS